MCWRRIMVMEWSTEKAQPATATASHTPRTAILFGALAREGRGRGRCCVSRHFVIIKLPPLLPSLQPHGDAVGTGPREW
jgi:hypothetical protein